MIISDLSYLEVVTEASSVVGGGDDKGKKGKDHDYYKKINANVAVINQVATATAVAISYGKGDAVAKASASNYAEVEQNIS